MSVGFELDITSANYVYIDWDPFDKDVLEDVKEIPGREFVDTSNRPKQWKFKLNKTTMRPFLQLCNKWDIDIPTSIKNRMQDIVKEAKQWKRQKEENEQILKSEEPDLDKVYGTSRGMQLYGFQRKAVEYVENNEKVIIGDEQGTGKTVEAIGAIQHMDAYPALIVCPATLKYNWQKEWNTWLPRRTAKVQEASEGLDLRGSVSIINYAILWRYRERLREHDWGALVLDESHKVKNGSAKRSKAAKQIARRMDGDTLKLLLSGTAVVNRPKELINQLKILGVFEKEFGNFYSYTKRFCEGHQGRWGWDASGASNLDELHERLTKTCYIRRDKEDVMPELPDKQRQYIELDIGNRREYDAAEADVAAYIKKEKSQGGKLLEDVDDPDQAAEKVYENMGSGQEAMSHLVKLMKLKQLAAKGKFNPAKKWIRDFLDNESPLVVFAWHKEIVKGISDAFDCPHITGDTDNRRRHEIVEEFQDGQHDLLSLNMHAAGEGITLTEASNAVFLELPWTWGTVSQCEDRIHRIGTEEAVNIYFLLGRGTIDKDVFELLMNKRVVTEKVNRGKDVKGADSDVISGVIDRLKEKGE